MFMPAKSFVSKTNSKKQNFEPEPKEYNTLEDYLKEHEAKFKEFLEFFDSHYGKANALRTLNKIEKALDISATASKEGSLNKKQIAETKADFMIAYIKEHLPMVFVEKTLIFISSKVSHFHIIEHLNQAFDLGDKKSNYGGGIIYKGEGAKDLPEHVDIREALDDELYLSALNIGRNLINRFNTSKNRTN